LYEKRERLKELTAINKATMIIRADKPISRMLKEIVEVIPPGWQYPEDAVARIKYGNDEYLCSTRFHETKWFQRKTFETIDGRVGSLEVFYLNQHPDSDEGPLLLRNVI
jgi:hypothetical protein